MKIDWFELHEGKVVSRWYGFSYSDYCMAFDILYPIPINILVRYYRKFYWGFLKAFYWVGLIDGGRSEAFSWRDFYRIKSH